MSARSDLQRLQPVIDSIITNTPRALTELRDAIDLAGDGYPTSASGADRTATRGGPTWRIRPDEHGPEERIPVTSVEATVGRVTDLLRQHDNIRNRLTKLLEDATNLDVDIRRHITVPEPVLCDRGVGRDGGCSRDGLEVVCVVKGCLCGGWGDVSCRNVSASDRGGLCMACAKREYRYRKEHGLPPRNLDVA